MSPHDFFVSVAKFAIVFALVDYVRGFFRAWREDRGPRIFTYHEYVIGGFGGLVTSGTLTREERIAAAPAWLEALGARRAPADGDRFVLVDGKFRKI